MTPVRTRSVRSGHGSSSDNATPPADAVRGSYPSRVYGHEALGKQDQRFYSPKSHGEYDSPSHRNRGQPSIQSPTESKNPVNDEAARIPVSCNNCGFVYDRMKGPIEYIETCRHYLCHSCLLQKFALSLVSPKFMPPRCSCDGEISLEKAMRRILVHPKLNEIWVRIKTVRDYWRGNGDVKLRCACGHNLDRSSLTVTVEKPTVWKSQVNCSGCSTLSVQMDKDGSRGVGHVKRTVYCLFCSKAIDGHEHQCRKLILRLLDRLMPSTAGERKLIVDARRLLEESINTDPHFGPPSSQYQTILQAGVWDLARVARPEINIRRREVKITETNDFEDSDFSSTLSDESEFSEDSEVSLDSDASFEDSARDFAYYGISDGELENNNSAVCRYCGVLHVSYDPNIPIFYINCSRCSPIHCLWCGGMKCFCSCGIPRGQWERNMREQGELKRALRKSQSIYAVMEGEFGPNAPKDGEYCRKKPSNVHSWRR
ncbi:hypothetical protein B0T24DRAFT_640078 [Lasiosphaeria ovina]|uniref:RING-type domain-containing protein n=1 Tax=Lasiosphaeria ovina TaxID=92902 RepID=A0AAE0MZ64_9PEZI|nr:hypothetical protein B0T24DRAFT_640078 [Lasiosphaeria ovina]